MGEPRQRAKKKVRLPFQQVLHNAHPTSSQLSLSASSIAPEAYTILRLDTGAW